MKRIAGVALLLLALYAGLGAYGGLGESNLVDVANRQGLFGILTLSAAVLILSGSIDLSLGSVVALGAVLFGTLMGKGVHPYLAVALTVLAGAGIGLVHGLLVHGLKLQSFLVTLCGMFVWRGVARLMANNVQVGLQQVTNPAANAAAIPEFAAPIETLRRLLIGVDADGELVVPATLFVFAALAAAFGLVLHGTTHGRYWLALGYSEPAARYAGVRVGRYRVLSFVIASTLGAFGGVVLLLTYGSVLPDNAGQSYELDAITGAVLGGVSLRGGEGTIAGMILGAAVLPVLKNLMTFAKIPDNAIPVIVGVTLFTAAFTDELVRRRGAGRKA